MKEHGKIENVHYYDIYPFTYAPNKERKMYNCKSVGTSGCLNGLLQWSWCPLVSIQLPVPMTSYEHYVEIANHVGYVLSTC